MNMRLLPRHYALSTAGRVHLPARSADAPVSIAEMLVLPACGAIAAVFVLLLDFKLKVPGHAVLRAVFPMALGLALVPRRGAGTAMGAGAVATAALLIGIGWGDKGLGSLTSLALIGPVLDFAMKSTASGRGIYRSFITAGVVANLLALVVQATAKSAGWDNSASGKSLAVWLLPALATYPLCGALAGYVSAVAWFRRDDPAGPAT